jgi:acyl-CoA reductase-like NAD-dependent aldehyde dehydrogenase
VIRTVTAPKARESFEVRCPATGHTVGTAPVLDGDAVAAMASELRAAQPEWAEIGFAGRARWMGLWRDWLLDNEERLIALVRAESGKSTVDANFEVPVAVEVLNYYVKHAAAFLAPHHVAPHSLTMATKRRRVSYEPIQLVGLITPWNAPLGLAMLDLPAALMAGCAVLSKPSEEVPLSWMECVRGWREDLGAPLVLACATGPGTTGEAVVDTVDMVHFTGSVRTGRRIAVRAAERLIPCTLELGGKDAMIVCADADLDRAANAAVWGAFNNAGQMCVSVERVYVEAGAYEPFLARVIELTRRMRVGSETDATVRFDYGAMANESQLRLVAEHVDEAIAMGATAVTGGARMPGAAGHFFAPTVLVDVDHSMRCMREETFGPTLPIMRAATVEEAIDLANDSPYGLSASVWTADAHKGRAVADRLHAGAVNINNVFINVFQLGVTQGGWGDSGLGGRLGGPAGIRKYCREKAVIHETITASTELHWYPASTARLAVQKRASRLLGARDIRRRLNLRPGRR